MIGGVSKTLQYSIQDPFSSECEMRLAKGFQKYPKSVSSVTNIWIRNHDQIESCVMETMNLLTTSQSLTERNATTDGVKDDPLVNNRSLSE